MKYYVSTTAPNFKSKVFGKVTIYKVDENNMGEKVDIGYLKSTGGSYFNNWFVEEISEEKALMLLLSEEAKLDE